jgi:ribosomal protein S18 acetylase RimI-like enzyme
MPPIDEWLGPDAAPAPNPAPDAEGVRWVPVRNLTARHRHRIVDHLTALGERDRYLRFGFVASDDQVRQYVDRIDFERDEAFGVFDRRLSIAAMAHLAFLEPVDGRPQSAEFGVSVSERLRGKGIGTRLFEHAMVHARNRGVDTLLIHALSENTPMLKIARHAGARVERSGGDSDAWLKLPPVNLASRLEEFVEGGAAEIDYSLKRQAHQLDGLMHSLAEVSAGLIKSRRGGSE